MIIGKKNVLQNLETLLAKANLWNTYIWFEKWMHFKFFATLKPENQHRTGSFVKADFLRCLPKEKTFKRLSLNLYCFNDDTSTSGLTYTQEEADRTCDALLALSFTSLYIGVCGGRFSVILCMYWPGNSFVEMSSHTKDCLLSRSSKKFTFAEFFYFCWVSR